jgi:hypothetical protein
MSVFGAKRKWTGRQSPLIPSLVTHSGHGPALHVTAAKSVSARIKALVSADTMLPEGLGVWQHTNGCNRRQRKFLFMLNTQTPIGALDETE